MSDALAMQGSHNTYDSSHSALHEVVMQTPNLAKARDEFLSLLFAARDTTASLLCWIFYALAREPHVYDKLKSEISFIMSHDVGIKVGLSQTPGEAQLSQMHYLDAIIYETLRLFPPVPINGRTCSESTTLPFGGGIEGEEPTFIPRGTLICFSTYGTHRSRKHWGEDAGIFKPDRWLGDDGTVTENLKVRTRDWTFHAFIGGPRKCLGGKF